MNNLNNRQKYYSFVIRLGLLLLGLVMLLWAATGIQILKDQIYGVKIAQAIIALLITAVLLYFTYITETQLPKIQSSLKPLALIVSSVVHIAVIFIAYYYLKQTPIAKNLSNSKAVNPIFNWVFVILLCVPLLRAALAYFDWAKRISEVLVSDIKSETIRCSSCGLDNAASAKHCANCGVGLAQFMDIKKCLKCSAENSASANFCISCGNNFQDVSLTLQSRQCPKCETKNKAEAKHCSECGNKLS